MSEGSFEAKLTAKRETAAGIYLTVQVQPEDYNADLATLRVGSHLMLGWAEIVNTAVEPIVADPKKMTVSDVVEERTGVAAPKDRRPFASLPLSQQAAIRSTDKRFWEYAKVANEEEAAQFIRKACAVTSRADIGNTAHSIRVWGEIEARFKAWLTDEMYAEARR